MKVKALFVAAVLMSGCAVTPDQQPAFRVGDHAIAQHFSKYPQYNGTHVTVTGGYRYRWISDPMYQGNALKVYEITTVDGATLAAQPFQLKKIE